MAALNLWKHFWGFNWALQWFWLSICVIIVMRNPSWDQPLQIPPTLIVKGKEFAAHIDKGEEKESCYCCFTEGWKHGGSTELWHCLCASSRGLLPVLCQAIPTPRQLHQRGAESQPSLWIWKLLLGPQLEAVSSLGWTSPAPSAFPLRAGAPAPHLGDPPLGCLIYFCGSR